MQWLTRRIRALGGARIRWLFILGQWLDGQGLKTQIVYYMLYVYVYMHNISSFGQSWDNNIHLRGQIHYSLSMFQKTNHEFARGEMESSKETLIRWEPPVAGVVWYYTTNSNMTSSHLTSPSPESVWLSRKPHLEVAESIFGIPSDLRSLPLVFNPMQRKQKKTSYFGEHLTFWYWFSTCIYPIYIQ